MSRTRTRYKRYRRKLSPVLPVLLLAIYFIGGTALDFVHHTVHDHSANVVVQKQYGYSPAKQAHIDSAAKCKYGHIIFYSQPWCSGNNLAFAISPANYVFCHYISAVVLTRQLTSFLRGPPAT